MTEVIAETPLPEQTPSPPPDSSMPENGTAGVPVATRNPRVGMGHKRMVRVASLQGLKAAQRRRSSTKGGGITIGLPAGSYQTLSELQGKLDRILNVLGLDALSGAPLFGKLEELQHQQLSDLAGSLIQLIRDTTATPTPESGQSRRSSGGGISRRSSFSRMAGFSFEGGSGSVTRRVSNFADTSFGNSATSGLPMASLPPRRGRNGSGPSVGPISSAVSSESYGSTPPLMMAVDPYPVDGLMEPHLGSDLLSGGNSLNGGSRTASPYGSVCASPVPQFLITASANERVDDDGFDAINDYVLLEECGSGKYGTVMLGCVNGTNDMRAIKIVPKRLLQQRHRSLRPPPMGDDSGSSSPASLPAPEPEPSPIQMEIAIMKKVRHPNIVPLLEVIDDPQHHNLYLVMPYIERGPVVQLTADGTCPPLDLDICRGYLRQIAKGLAYLHKRKIAHRDIKPDNILLGADGVVRIVDFGVSSIFTDAQQDAQGTPAFMAPETMSGDAFELPPTDMWALGVTLYVMVFGTVPFRGHNLPGLVRSIRTEDPPYAFPMKPRAQHKHVKHLISKLLEKNPDSRYTVQDVLKHRFVTCTGSSDSELEESMRRNTIAVTEWDIQHSIVQATNVQ